MKFFKLFTTSFANEPKKVSPHSPLKAFQKRLKKLITIDDSQTTIITPKSLSRPYKKKTAPIDITSHLTASTPLKSQLNDELIFAENSINSVIDNVIFATMNNSEVSTATDITTANTPRGSKKKTTGGKRKGRNNLANAAIERSMAQGNKSKLKPGIDFDENTNDMLYSDLSQPKYDTDDEVNVLIFLYFNLPSSCTINYASKITKYYIIFGITVRFRQFGPEGTGRLRPN